MPAFYIAARGMAGLGSDRFTAVNSNVSEVFESPQEVIQNAEPLAADAIEPS